jgi:hypothetical protein
MGLSRNRAMQQPAETQCATEPLPLFRPEVLSKQERFFGEVLRIRPFSFGFLAWLVLAMAALTGAVVFFGTHTQSATVRVALRGTALRSSQPSRTGHEAAGGKPQP